MEPVKPLSIKFAPEIRKQIKKIAFLLDWPEGHFVNASVAVVLDMVEGRLKMGEGKMPRTVFLARQVLDFEKSQLKQPHSPPPRRKSVAR
jgi:hypothetical protein